MHKSFLDSIVVELCLPNSKYSKQIMLQLLDEAITESPNETKRFPQALWDAVGDFSVGIFHIMLAAHTHFVITRTGDGANARNSRGTPTWDGRRSIEANAPRHA